MPFLSGQKVLVIEKDAIIALLLEIALSDGGADCRTAGR